MHRLPQVFLESTVRILVVGCGGTGSAFASALPYLHQALIASGHPHGINATLIDGDIVSASNCVRQPFSQSDIGLHKAVVLTHRINAFWGLRWTAQPGHLKKARNPIASFTGQNTIVVGCVDTRKARKTIQSFAVTHGVRYWLDIGNNASGGQFVLGEPCHGALTDGPRLRTVAELYPETVDSKKEDQTEPSCSAAEALDRQEPFVNQVLANHALALLARLFRHGEISHQGGFVNLESGRCAPMVI